jgi:dTDP-4-amino-4,6-dideoxygalactose transaminase
MNPDVFAKSLNTFEAAHKENGHIFVTRPDLPPLDEFTKYLEKIWQRRWVTNNGLFHQQFEEALAKYLGVKYVSLFSNGTLALVVATQVLRLSGEVITTPYSFVATTHALNWNGIKPVFCDIDPLTLNLDPDKIEELITPQTSAILPVHVYGNPCDVEKIGQIADTYGLKVLYDAAHAFGVKIGGDSILNFGELSVLSFHATKIFTTMEGGAIVTNDEKLKKRIDYLKNFGFADETTVIAPGINGKMNEMQAALGLLQLKHVNKNIKARKEITHLYREQLIGMEGVQLLADFPDTKHNYAYFPVFIDQEQFGTSRDDVYEELKRHDIYTRRYFYPLISEFPMYKGLPSGKPENLSVATRLSRQVLCLPLYPDLNKDDVNRITDIIRIF